jgi:rhamnogalacturonyl hydrolase YesR
MKKYLFVLFVLIILSSCSNEEPIPDKPDKPNPPAETVDYAGRAKEIHDRILGAYGFTAGNYAGLLRENVPPQSGEPACSFLWSYDGWASGVTLLKKLGYDVDYVKTIDNFERYYTIGSSINPTIPAFGPGTDGTYHGGNGDRYYDDNSIVGINLVDAYKLTNNVKYLNYAKDIVAFLQSGKDNHLGGAIWWRENSKNPNATDENSNKPTCANGYGTCFLLDYYSICPQGEKTAVLAFAKELYQWLYDNLRDPNDNTYYNAKQAQGSLQTMKWTYNSGVMIQNALRLYDITGEQKYLNHAIATGSGSHDYFVKTRNGLSAMPDNDQWFNTKLFIAYIELAEHYSNAKNWVSEYEKYINYAYKNSRNNSGFFYEGWSNSNSGRSFWLLIQAATVESYGALALYYKK